MFENLELCLITKSVMLLLLSFHVFDSSSNVSVDLRPETVRKAMGGPPRVRGDPLGSRRSERESSMLFFHMHVFFFSRFLLSRNYYIQNVVLIERNSVVLLLGCLGSSRRFFSSTDVLGVDRHSTDYRQASKTATNKTPDTLGVEESSSPRRVLHF